MPMAKFTVWDPANGDEEDALLIENTDAEQAAILFSERRHASDDYPEERVLHVRDEGGALTRWVVTTMPSVYFLASPVEPMQGVPAPEDA